MEQVTRTQYGQVHHWLAVKFGKAVACENPKCEGKSVRFQYALRAGKTHKKLRANYMTLCHQCHVEYDTKHKNKGHVNDTRLSMKLLWKLRGEFMESSYDVYDQRDSDDFLDFVESSLKGV